MKKLGLALCLLITLAACTITKRQHLGGWHVEWKHHHKSDRGARAARPPSGQPSGDRHHVRRAVRQHGRGVHRATDLRRTRLVLGAPHGILLGRVRAVHHVPAAALPDAPADHRRGLLLQHRPARRRSRVAGLRLAGAGGRFPSRASGIEWSRPGRRGLVLVAAGTDPRKRSHLRPFSGRIRRPLRG